MLAARDGVQVRLADDRTALATALIMVEPGDDDILDPANCSMIGNIASITSATDANFGSSIVLRASLILLPTGRPGRPRTDGPAVTHRETRRPRLPHFPF